MKLKGILIIGVIVLGVLTYYSTFVVDERQQVVITQFGRIVGDPISDPGLKFKLPYRTANFFPKNIQDWDGDPGQIPTLDKTFIWVDTFARWKIVDPIKFFQTVNNRFNAVGKLNDIIDPAVRNFITSYSLIEAVRNSNREMDTLELLAKRLYNKEIAAELNVSAKTVEAHRAHVMEKMEAGSLAELVRMAMTVSAS